ncbi:ATP-binding protein [Haliscomenobacter sp.]|uniref:ATP-binding protein n=1 Tax=Haliscomenobacter sp. TaxID=2717303 RepID=UPI0035946CB3
MRYFNTSGPNIPEQHYTLFREDLILTGLTLVERDRYFTIWAPRQTGKSTYFRQLNERLTQTEYKVAQFNFENYKGTSQESLLAELVAAFQKMGYNLGAAHSFSDFSVAVQQQEVGKVVLIFDEVEGLNPDLFGQFLHTIRNLYHSRQDHCLKSVILVGVSNIVGVAEDNASPFNIADNLNVPYFTDVETAELLHQHELETGQHFEPRVIQKISEITANQPGLVNGFAYQLVARNKDKALINYQDYLAVEEWYLTEAIDKNFANILKQARAFRPFIESLLFTDIEIPFRIDREAIKVLHTNGLIRKGEGGNVQFWVPYYKKRLHDVFYPYTNGEKDRISATIYAADFFLPDGQLNLDLLIDSYKAYAKRRGFGVFREKDEQGKFTSIKEAGLIYSFETFLAAFVQQTGGKSYREASTGLGKSDLLLNIQGREFIVEAKKYYGFAQFEKGKNQLAYYASRLGLSKAVYLVFTPNHLRYPPPVVEGNEVLNSVEIRTYLVDYDEEKDFE